MARCLSLGWRLPSGGSLASGQGPSGAVSNTAGRNSRPKIPRGRPGVALIYKLPTPALPAALGCSAPAFDAHRARGKHLSRQAFFPLHKNPMKKDQNYCPRFTSANTKAQSGRTSARDARPPAREPGFPRPPPARPLLRAAAGPPFPLFLSTVSAAFLSVAALHAAQLNSPSQRNGTSGALKLRARPAGAPASRTPPPAALTPRSPPGPLFTDPRLCYTL